MDYTGIVEQWDMILLIIQRLLARIVIIYLSTFLNLLPNYNLTNYGSETHI